MQCDVTLQTRCQRWVINCRREDLLKRKSNYLYNNCRLCSLHFEDSQFMNTDKRKLTWNAIPTIFNIPNPPSKIESKRPSRSLIKNQMNPEKKKLVGMGRKCCAPGCRSNYDNEKNYVTVFKFPSDPERHNLWVRNLNRENFTPSPTAVVCINHFEDRFIIKEDKVKRNDGSLLVVPRKKFMLTSDAYPTIFQNLPTYLTKNLPSKTLSNPLQKPANDVNEKLIVSSSELPIPVSKIKQETEEVILPSNDEHLNYILNQRAQVPVINNVQHSDINGDNSDKQYQDFNTKKKQVETVAEKSLPESKRNFPDSNENSFIEEYYKAKLEVLNKEHNAKLNAIKAKYELKIKFLKEEYEYKLEYLKSKKEYKVLKKLKLQNV